MCHALEKLFGANATGQKLRREVEDEKGKKQIENAIRSRDSGTRLTKVGHSNSNDSMRCVGGTANRENSNAWLSTIIVVQFVEMPHTNMHKIKCEYKRRCANISFFASFTIRHFHFYLITLIFGFCCEVICHCCCLNIEIEFFCCIWARASSMSTCVCVWVCLSWQMIWYWIDSLRHDEATACNAVIFYDQFCWLCCRESICHIGRDSPIWCARVCVCVSEIGETFQWKSLEIATQ